MTPQKAEDCYETWKTGSATNVADAQSLRLLVPRTRLPVSRQAAAAPCTCLHRPLEADAQLKKVLGHVKEMIIIVIYCSFSETKRSLSVYSYLSDTEEGPARLGRKRRDVLWDGLCGRVGPQHRDTNVRRARANYAGVRL